MPRRRKTKIPKLLHIVWIGDESKRPSKGIATWKRRNPSLHVKVWGNEDLTSRRWRTWRNMQKLLPAQIHGVADMMRWEILHEFGGLAVDADTICVHALDDWLFELEAFACWENELVRPGLISNGFVATIPNNGFFGRIVRDIARDTAVASTPSWRSVGPGRLTDSYHKYGYTNLTILPSHFAAPRHFTGVEYTGSRMIYCTQQWSSTNAFLSERTAGRRGKPPKFEIFGHKSWLQFRS
jgi:mannosyltransferase OCH1-like enzyme